MPVGIISIQGGNNVGQVQLLMMPDAMTRTGILAWHDAGVSGREIRIGILDQGFGGLQTFVDTAEGVVQVASGADLATYDADPIRHGTDVLLVVHSIAPDTKYFVCRYFSFDEYRLCIDWMLAAGVKIVNHSAGVPALPLDGTNRWARQLERAANANILWVNAAGNFAQGYYTDYFTDNNANRFYEFRGATGINESLGIEPITTARQGVVMLSWADHVGKPANAINIDLEVVDAHTGDVLARSQNEQRGQRNDEPIEYLSFNMDRPFGVRIVDFAGEAAGTRFVLFVEFARLPNGEIQRSIISPGDSASVLTVGALQGASIAPYSSRGPIETGAIKPDLAAPGEVLLSDGSLFVGTSAAAPVVSGSAALIWEANPNYTARDVRTFILNATQDDDEFFGMDINFGNGRLYLSLPDSTPQLPTATSSLTLTSEPIGQPTDTSLPQPTNTIQPPPTATDRPSSIPRPQATTTVSTDATVTINVSTANFRTGPGTNYSIAGSASSGQTFVVIARYEDWYLIDRGSQSDAWVWEGIVNLSGSESQIEVAVTVPSTPITINVSTFSGNCNLGLTASWFREGANGESGIRLSWSSFEREVTPGYGRDLMYYVRAGSVTVKWDTIVYSAIPPYQSIIGLSTRLIPIRTRISRLSLF